MTLQKHACLHRSPSRTEVLSTAGRDRKQAGRRICFTCIHELYNDKIYPKYCTFRL